jgi:hypothetical protein
LVVSVPISRNATDPGVVSEVPRRHSGLSAAAGQIGFAVDSRSQAGPETVTGLNPPKVCQVRKPPRREVIRHYKKAACVNALARAFDSVCVKVCQSASLIAMVQYRNLSVQIRCWLEIRRLEFGGRPARETVIRRARTFEQNSKSQFVATREHRGQPGPQTVRWRRISRCQATRQPSHRRTQRRHSRVVHAPTMGT